MPRKKRAYKRIPVEPDPKYGRELIGKFINHLMKKGKKTLAQKVFYRALDAIKEKMPDKDPLEVFYTALSNCMPELETRPRRVGGATYQIPMEVPEDRKKTLAMRWILEAARARKGRPMFRRLAEELIDAYNNQGAAIKKKEDTHRMAEANRAFAHFRWGR